MAIESFAKGTHLRSDFIGGSNARTITAFDEGALTRLSHEQNAQTKSKRSVWVITGDPRHTRAHAAKSSTTQAHFLLPIGRKYSRARHRERQTAANLAAFMAGIRRFMKACAILWQKIYACVSEHSFDQANRVPGSHVATHLNIRGRASMKTGRLSQVPNRPIQRSARSEVVHLSQERIVDIACEKVRTIIALSSNQGGTE
jgi:hypothetical protein